MALKIILPVLLAIAGQPLAANAQSVGDRLVTRTTAERHGLRQAWFGQIELDRASDRVLFVRQHTGMLMVQTAKAMVHALDAETGETMWAVQIGRSGLISVAPAANEKYVAVLNGTTLYVVDRRDGRLKWERELTGVPGAGSALSKTHVFVPMVDGLVEGYQLEDPDARPWTYRSNGRIQTQPIVTPRTLTWTTNRGHFYVAKVDKVEILLRLETSGTIESRPAYWTPFVYATSLDGNVYAIHEVEGETQWRFATANPISQPPVAINGFVYVATESSGMYQLDGTTGQERWFAPNVTRFLSASPSRVYGCNRFDQMVMLDIKTGRQLDSMPVGAISFPFINSETDRIYFCTRSGQIQCLHEVGLRTPVHYEPPAPPAPAKPDEPPKAAPAEEEAEAAEPAKEKAEAEPPAEEEAPAEKSDADADNPFG